MRFHLPDDRESITTKFVINSTEFGRVKCYLIVGFYDDGTPGEVFTRIAKEGSIVGTLVDQWCIAVSMALQLGMPVEGLISKFRGVTFEPRGWVETHDSRIHSCSSPIDFAMQWLNNYVLDRNSSESSESTSESSSTPTSTST